VSDAAPGASGAATEVAPAAERDAGSLSVVEDISARALTIPTDAPEADGTLSWDATTVVVVEVRADGHRGTGFSYAAGSAAQVVTGMLADAVCGADALSPRGAWPRMRAAVRNIGYPGVAASAISAVDVALWDLKARLLGVPVSTLIGRVRDGVRAYGSGGFTSYDDERLREQLGGWAAEGLTAVKMKVGSEPERDPHRARTAREAIGERVELFVDANGAYDRKQALALAERFRAEAGVSWFEEPVSSDDLEGLRLLRDRAPAGMQIAAGEYGYGLHYFRRMLEAGAVDVLQADVTRCGGITAMLGVAALCEARSLELSAHTSPSLHAHVGCALEPLVHIEYFHDHARIEQMLFDGAPVPVAGELHPDLARTGFGLELREEVAERYAA
jgi:L-alanine-DL-glutamate epimerase-like enolase superfamily enzyme